MNIYDSVQFGAIWIWIYLVKFSHAVVSGNCSQCKLASLFQSSIIGSVQFNLKGLLGLCGGTYSTCATY